MTIEKIETNFIIDDGFPSPKIISNSNNLYLNFRVDDENYETVTLKFLNHHLYKIGYPGNETLYYHPYSIYGINSSEIYLIKNSDWINELKEIAEKIGVHEATVSRVANGKYVQTDWGTFEMRRFFTNAINQEKGKNISKEAVKAEISQIIQELEAKGEKISDRIISEILARRGMKIARRTVAKYRGELGK